MKRDQIRSDFMSHFINCFNCRFTEDCDQQTTYRATHLQPQPGFVGRNYKGLVFLGGNPSAGGKDSHKEQAANLYRRINKLSKSKEREDFDDVMNYLSIIMPSWYVLDRSLSDSFSSLGTNLKDIAYINIFKCPTQKNGSNYSVHASPAKLRVCFDKHTRPQLEILKPKTIIFLWKPIFKSISTLGYDLSSVNSDYWDGARNLSSVQRYERLNSIKKTISKHYKN